MKYSTVEKVEVFAKAMEANISELENKLKDAKKGDKILYIILGAFFVCMGIGLVALFVLSQMGIV